jgi:hypothetical protein
MPRSIPPWWTGVAICDGRRRCREHRVDDRLAGGAAYYRNEGHSKRKMAARVGSAISEAAGAKSVSQSTGAAAGASRGIAPDGTGCADTVIF